MAKNIKRIPIKWVRDLSKKDYVKKDNCEICCTTEDLELHHIYSLSFLLEVWAEKKGYQLTSDEAVLAVRQEFIDEHRKELYNDVITLCNKHHTHLHKLYGKIPALNTAEKQRNWVLRLRQRYENKEVSAFSELSGSGFSEFY
jgi:hypothetical protein